MRIVETARWPSRPLIPGLYRPPWPVPVGTLCGMNNAEALTYLAPVIVLHISLICGVMSYACKYCDRNSPLVLIALVAIQMVVAGIATARRRPAGPRL